VAKFSDDTVRGARALAAYIFGDSSKRRAVYGMTEARKRRYGLYRDGKVICGRKSTIDLVGRPAEEQEGGAE
jgi:hypothetical protein